VYAKIYVVVVQPKFVSLPRHVFGEMAKNSVGLKHLKDGEIIHKLIRTCKDETASCLRRRAAMWSLGHIGASDLGCEEVCAVDASFVDWVVLCCCSNASFALRSTAFNVLGLLGRSKQGMRFLQNAQWDVSPFYSNSAVAFPKDTSQLFQRDSESEGAKESDVLDTEISPHPSAPQSLEAIGKPFGHAATPEAEVLNLIAKVGYGIYQSYVFTS
jgi:hypothetical protein